MYRVLLIEPSATLARAMQKVLQQQNYVVDISNQLDAGLEILLPPEKCPDYDAIILGWSSQTETSTDDLLINLGDAPYDQLPALVMSHDADSAKLGWVSGRQHTGFLMWENYEDAINILPKIISPLETVACCDHADNSDIHVLLVDDSPTARAKFRKLLDKCGYQTTIAANATEAFEKAMQQKFDIAIIDYFMPEENGDALCKKLKSHPRTTTIVPAVLTSTYLDRVIESSLAAGAVECMFKNESDELFRSRVAAMSRGIRITKHIELERTRLQGILASVGDGVYGVNQLGTITFINPAARRSLGLDSNEEIVGRSPSSIFHYYDNHETETTHVDLKYIEHAIIRGRELHGIESIFTRADGTPIHVELTIYPLKISGQQDGAVVAFRDVSVRKLLEEELKWQANHDPLTKLLNRKYLEETLEQEVRRLKRSDKQSALIYIDLDRFKYINDTTGHAAGDQLLIEISRQLKARLRETDILSRLGGDEFGLLLRNIDKEDVYQTAEIYRGLISNYDFMRDGRIYKVHASLGVAMIDSETSSPGEVLANADIACHTAKGQGRNSTHVYEPEQDSKTAMDLELGWSMRLGQALENDKFQLYYQPIMSLHDLDLNDLPETGSLCEHLVQTQPQCCSTYEVLLRLHNSHGEPIAPGSFLPTAERFNMMRDIDTWVVKAAIKMISELGPEDEHLCFTINLSGQSMDPSLIVPIVREGLTRHKIDPARLLFEITETCAVNDIYAACGLIEELSKLGCRFALDDFGSGYCSFSHLKRLPVDYIKIDGMFVQDMLNDPMDIAIVRSITNISHTLGKETIAEFVESPDVLKLLKECGVDYVQGYYIAKPSPNLIRQKLEIRDIIG